MNKLLVVELDGMTDILSECQLFGWEAVFIETELYKSWLPVDNDMRNVLVHERSSLSFLDMIRFSEDNGISSILPVSLLEPECERDALAKDYISQYNLPFRILANTPSTIELTYDKWLTKEMFTMMGFPVVPGRLAQSGKQLPDIAKEYGFPLIFKHRKTFTGQGMRIIKNNEALQNYITKYDAADIIVEPFISGSEISVEVIAWKGKKVFQPLVYKGETRVEIYEHPAYRPRISPWKANSNIEREIINIVDKAVDIFHLCGAAEFEFVIADDRPLLLEVNPRISGVTRLCNAARGINSYKLLTQIAVKDEIVNYAHTTKKYAMQLPLTIMPDENLSREFMNDRNLHYIKPITWIPILPIKSNIIVSYNSPDELSEGILKYRKYTNDNYLKEAENTIKKSI